MEDNEFLGTCALLTRLCSAPPSTGICHRNSQLNCIQRLCDWVEGRSISVSYIYIYIYIYSSLPEIRIFITHEL